MLFESANLTSQTNDATRVAEHPPSVKSRFRRIVVKSAYGSGLLQAARALERSHAVRRVSYSRLPRFGRFSGSKFGILCYHRVGTNGVPWHSRLSPLAFEAQMKYLRKHYRVVSLSQLLTEIKDRRSVVPTVVVTFDDGYRDLYTHALPVLQKYQIPATIYLIGQCMETGQVPWYDAIFAVLMSAPGPVLELEMNGLQQFDLSSQSLRFEAAWAIVCYLRSVPDLERQTWCVNFHRRFPCHEAELRDRMLNWEQVRNMQRHGMFFGAHTMTHPSVSRLSSIAFDREFLHVKRSLEDGLGCSVQDFAYPFGKPQDRTIAAEEYLLRCGYRSAVTTTCGFNSFSCHPFRMCRLQVSDDQELSAFAFSLFRMFFEIDLQEPCPSEDRDSEEIGSSVSGLPAL